MAEQTIFPSIPAPAMDLVAPGVQADRVIVDNRTDLPGEQVLAAVQDHWVESAGLQFGGGGPSVFQLYANQQSSMLARTPFRTPGNVIDEIRLARSVADSDDDVAATIGMMLALAFGEGLQNHHRDEKTLEFYNQMTGPTGMDLESICEEMYRELLIASSVTTLQLFTRNRMEYWPLKADQPVKAQLQVPHVGVLPAENLRVLTNDVMNTGVLAYYTEEPNFKRWLDEFFSPTTSGQRKAIMAMQEPIPAALFTGRVDVPWNDADPNIAGRTVYTMNQRMVQRTTMPKGAQPYARPLLTRNFALLEAKRLLNIMDYALLQGGTNYIVVAKKGTDNMPAQQEEVENLGQQITHASRSGVMVGDHRLTIEIITPDLKELLSPTKRNLLGRKIAMGLLRQTEQNTPDPGTQGAVNEMELLARVVSSDRAKLLRHAQATFYDDTATRNRTVFDKGAPTIWGPKIILAGAKDFWSQVLNARDRGDIPRRWAVEALGFNYEAGLAEREREIERGDDDILAPASVPFSNPGEPQDNNEGRPPGSSPDNGKPNSPKASGVVERPRKTISRNAGETVKAFVEGTDVIYVGETTLALLEGCDLVAGYITETDRDAISSGHPIRHARSITVPVNEAIRCDDYRAFVIDDGLRVVVGSSLAEEAMVVKALRFSEPQYDLKAANDYAIRWGFLEEPMIDEEEAKKRRRHAQASGIRYCVGCGNPVATSVTTCPSCGLNPSPEDGGSSVPPIP